MGHRILFLRESVAYLALRLRSPDTNLEADSSSLCMLIPSTLFAECR